MPPALNEHSASDSSSIISSPPQSPQHNTNTSADEITVARPTRPTSAFGEGVVGATSAHAPQAHILPTQHAPEHTPQPQPSTAPVKVKKPRKPREPKEPQVTPDGQPIKEKKPRKPREPKVKTEGAPNAAPRKRAKAADKTAPAPAPEVTSGPRQSTLTGQFYQPGQPASAPQPQPQQPLPSTLATSPRPQLPSTSENMSRTSITPQLTAQSSAPQSRPYSSGQNYDPIRGATYDHAPPRPAAVANGAHSAQASPQVNRASASPSIQSLIDPPQPLTTSTPNTTYAQQANLQPVQQQTASFVKSPNSPRPSAAPPVVHSLPPSPLPNQQQSTATASMDGAMDVDEAPKQPALKAQPQSKSSSSAPTPKPSKPVSPPAKPASKAGTGSGLLSSNNLFGGPSSETDAESKGLTIDFRIKLDPAGGNQINIAKEIIKNYGSDAIDPHAAAHRSRLRAVALAQNKLEAHSTDDMSVDLGSELDGDSNVEMGGMDDERSGGGEPVRKRRKKVEEYDKEDDFIDDRELAWEENAAVAKDGFFVYSGPLVAEGEDAKVESSSAPTRGRGGGRGRGRGRGGAAAAAGGAPATTTAARKDPNAPAVPARGRGSRGGRGTTGGTVRKRPTKAEKEKADAEKAQQAGQFPIQQHIPPPAQGASTAVKSPSVGMSASSTMPAPVQPQHVLHSNYGGGSAPGGGDMQQARLQA